MRSERDLLHITGQLFARYLSVLLQNDSCELLNPDKFHGLAPKTFQP